MIADVPRPAGYPPVHAILILASVLVLFCAGGEARADGIRGRLEWNYSALDTKTEDNAGQRTETESKSFLQRYFLEFDRKVFPNLSLYASGIFERNATTTETDGAEIETTLRRLRPVAELRLRTPLYVAEASYRRNEQKSVLSGSPPVTEIQDAYSSSLQWKPDGYPRMRFLYFGTHNYDRAREFRDTIDNRFQATAEYRPVDPIFLRYEGTLQAAENRLENNEIKQETHSMRVAYGDSWRKGMVSVYTDYDVSRRETEVRAAGSGQITFPVPAIEGLSAIDDTPGEGDLDPNPALIDGNFAEQAGINLVLPSPGGDIRPRNAGLRFDAGARSNILFLWVVVDGELPQEIAGSFSWQVFASDDARVWTLVKGPAPAIFDPFLNRFEISFPAVSKPYVKAVVAPLSPTVPGATGLRVSVTELQAVLRLPAEEAVGEQVQVTHRYTLDVRTRLLEAPSVYYEFSYLLRKPDPGTSTWTLSNGLSATHRFSRILSGAARAAREDGKEREKDRVAYSYTASLTAIPLETLQHTLVFSGRHETSGGATQQSQSLFLQNNAQLYQGIDLNLGGGVSSQSRDTGEESLSTSLNGHVTLVPNRWITVNLNYNDTTTERSGGAGGDQTDFTRTGEANLTVTPLRTLYLFGSWGFVRQAGQAPRRNERYSATFSPFPAGTLRFNLFYSDEYQSQLNQRERIVSPSLRWNVMRTTTLDLAYSDLSTSSDLLRTETRVFSGNVRISF